ncbi:TetR/AcrR family transcriptional regulator [Comamonas thiooxydans]|uniref:TetR/AcrR family transcriptional regulator n=1 Tax=Comamonas thiooxydans TaxID=363952 RepID=UPI00244A7D60|nr:TetR/AcrR family transcriptional regulator [Comamonas thiooxydans]MDH1473380.1 TetR/AcrR family transcriptional regulator [Comamonas thiooxydans]
MTSVTHVISPAIINWVNVNYDALPATQLALLDAAAEAFTKLGFAAASIDVIAREIGATKGSVYYHYRSKGDLFLAVHKRAMILNFRAQVPVVERADLSPRQKLEVMTYKHAMLMMEHFYYQRVTVQGVELHQSASTTPSEREALEQIIAMRDAYEDFFHKVLEAGALSGEFAETDFRLASRAILGSLNWITMWYKPRAEDDSTYREHVAQQLSRQAISGVISAAPKKRPTIKTK